MRRAAMLFLLICAICLIPVSASLAQEPVVAAVQVEGNEQVVSDHILGVVETVPGEPLDREQVRKDIEAIYSLGFFSLVDVKLQQLPAGVALTFVVQENPIVEEVRFEGNTVYTEEQLKELVFTAQGTVFNRVFFRHDLQRVQEKYQEDGYVMVKIGDVSVEAGVVTVKIVEPRIGEIVIQGNTRTRTNVIARQIKVKSGDLFNSTILRHSLNKLQGMGYFEDVNVGFEPTDSPEVLNLVITVSEQKTGQIGISIGHGSSSGWSGGISYEDNNWQGLGNRASVGFEVGDQEQYWISYENPFMDADTYAWKIGAYKREWEEIDHYETSSTGSSLHVFEYDEDKTGGYIGAGKQFRGNDKLSWYLTLDWHEMEIYNVVQSAQDETNLGGLPPYYDNAQNLAWYKSQELLDGTTFSVIGSLTRNNLDPYLSYKKGDVESVNVEHAMEILGADFDFTKYWLEARYYTPLTVFEDFFDAQLGDKDSPVIFAARMKAGWSSGAVPWGERYEVGGKDTLRGYEDDQFQGDEMFLANFELRIPIEKAFSFVLFYDTGMAWGGSDPVHDSFSFDDLEDNFGVGIRVRTPLGNLRLDVADGEDETFTHFGFGELF